MPARPAIDASKRKARKVSRKPAVKAQAMALKGLPILWSQKGRGQAIGLHVDENEVWAGWESGDVVACDHDGNVLRRWKLPKCVDSLVGDEVWRYAGCRDGCVYDLTGRTPRVAYEIDKKADIQAIEIHRGNLLAADSHGACTVMDAEQNLLWKHVQKGGSSAWMVRGEGGGVYLGNSAGVTRLDWTGKKVWYTKTAWVGYGWTDDSSVYAIVDAWKPTVAVVILDKESGKLRARGSCFSKEPTYDRSHNAAACAAAPGGERIFGGTSDTIFCFGRDGKLAWETPTRCGATCSMAIRGDRMFVATHTGKLACLDISEAAVARAQTSAGARRREAQLSTIAETRRDVEETKSAGSGIVVECVREGGKLRVRVVSPGYHNDWFCQFPRDIRDEGAKFVVESVREATQGGFYRVLGEIKRLKS